MTGISRPGVDGGVQGGRESPGRVGDGVTEGAPGVKGEGGLGKPPGQSWGPGLILWAAGTGVGSREYRKGETVSTLQATPSTGT